MITQDPRLQRVANHLRSRRPDKIRDGVHALEIATEPLNFLFGSRPRGSKWRSESTTTCRAW